MIKRSGYRCLVCSFKESSEVFVNKDRMFNIPGEFAIRKCNKCGLLFLETKGFKIENYYPSSKYYAFSRKKSFLFRLRKFLIKLSYSKPSLARLLFVITREVSALPRKGSGKILDVGCGSAETLSILKDLGWGVYGIELDKKAVELAKRNKIENIIQGSYEKMIGFPDNYFDVIRFYHVLEHLKDPLDALKLSFKKLKKGGEIIVGTPNTSSLVAKFFSKYWYNLDTPRHLFLFNPVNLKKIFAKTGFNIGKLNYFSSGGVLGSLKYLIKEKSGIEMDFLNWVWPVILFHPLERVIDAMKLGDVIVLRGTK